MTRIFGVASVIAVMALAGCSDNDGAQRQLQQMGYTNIETTGYSFFGCGQDDSFHTGFNAVSPNGTPVSGVVCSGWFKGGTVRFD